MGIDLGDVVVKHPLELSALRGKRVAIDAWNVLYQFLSNIRQPDGTPLMNAQGDVTSHLAGTLYRTANLVDAGLKPIFVFDGQPHPLKRDTLAARTARRESAETEYAEALESGDEEKAFSKAQQTSRLSVPMAEQAMDLLRALGIPVVQAPGEGEAQAAAMCAAGDVDVVASQDFDTLLFGTPTLCRNLTLSGRRKLPGKRVWVDVTPEQIHLAESLEAMELTREQLIDAALLVGTDFHPGIKGIGPKKAIALIKKHGALEPILERLAADPDSADSAVERALLDQHEALAERDAVKQIFLNPSHTRDYALDMGKPDGDAVRSLMVETHGFSAERVDATLEKYGAARSRANQQSLFDF